MLSIFFNIFSLIGRIVLPICVLYCINGLSKLFNGDQYRLFYICVFFLIVCCLAFVLDITGGDKDELAAEYSNGYDEGYDKGYNSGWFDGNEAGYETGYDDRAAENRNDTYDNGYDEYVPR